MKEVGAFLVPREWQEDLRKYGEKETEAESKLRKDTDCMNKKLKRCQETEIQTMQRKEKHRKETNETRKNESPAHKTLRKLKDQQYKRNLRILESPAQKTVRQLKDQHHKKELRRMAERVIHNIERYMMDPRIRFIRWNFFN